MANFDSKPAIYPVILSGGVGSRLWPLSRSLFPKQLLAITGGRTMIQNTALRAKGPQFEDVLILCNQEHRFLIAEQMRTIGVAPLGIVLEPAGRNTAPAAAIAAIMIAQKDPDGVILLMPADHIVRDEAAFAVAVATAAEAARRDRLVTFGVTPCAPETGYGYIQRGDELSGSEQTFHVVRFVEKPDRAAAEKYLTSGDYYWNSGMFAFKASVYLEELERRELDMVNACRAAIAGGRKDLEFLRLAEKEFSSCRSISIDYAVMEHTDRAVLVPVEMGWSDIGSWESLWESDAKDETGNVLCGDVIAESTRNAYLRSEGPLVAAVGVEDIVIVATPDAVLVSAKGAAQNVKKIVEELERRGRELHINHRKVSRPWGSYESLDSGEKFQVKRIIVNPGAKLSLQMHNKRAEHWVVVSGIATVTCGDKVFTLGENESTFIPLGMKHRLENAGAQLLHLIEVQSGTYFGEDDIVRFEDSYGR